MWKGQKKKKKKEQVSRRQKMAINVTLKFLKIVVIMEARNRKGVPQVGSAIKETVRVATAVASSYFKGKAVEPSCQSSSTLKFV